MFELKSFESLVEMSNLPEIADLRQLFEYQDWEAQITTAKNMQPDYLAAINLHKNEQGQSHLYTALDKAYFSVSTNNKALAFLQAIEVPHYNLYDIHIQGDARIIDAMIHRAQKGEHWENKLEKHKGFMQCFNYVASKTSDLNLIRNTGMTAAHSAIMMRSIPLLDVLVKNGADLNVRMCSKDCDELAEDMNRYGGTGDEFYKDYLAFRAQMQLQPLATSSKPRRSM